MNTILSRRRLALGLTCSAAFAASSSSAQALINEGFTDGGHTEGHAIALWGDILAVGAPNADKPGFPSISAAGAVMIYKRDQTNQSWILEQTLYSSAPAIQNHFGSAVALQDGLLIVGEPGFDLSVPNRGRISAYLNTDSSGVDFNYQDAQIGLAEDQLTGTTLAIAQSGNGPYVVLAGAPFGESHGIYASAWSISNNQATSMGSRFVGPGDIGPLPTVVPGFGSSVAIVPEVCVPANDCLNSFLVGFGFPGYQSGTGGAVVLKLITVQQVADWDFNNVQGILSDETPEPGESFGSSLAIDPGDGLQVPPRMIVGIPKAIKPLTFPGDTTGGVRLFEKQFGELEWTPGVEIYGPSGQSSASNFGDNVELVVKRAWVGAPFLDVPSGFGGNIVDAGAIFQLELTTCDTWIIGDELHLEPPSNSDAAGFSLDYRDGFLVSGAVLRGGFNTWLDESIFSDSFDCSAH